MKLARICMAIIATLMFATICAAQCGPAKPKGGGGGAGSLDSMIVAQEQMIVDAIKKRDANAFKSLVDMDATVIGGDGMHKVSEIIPMLFSPDLTFASYSLEDPQVKMVGKDTAMISYKSVATSTYKGKTETGTSYETTIYMRRAGKWMAIFHQSSEMEKPAEGMTGQK